VIATIVLIIAVLVGAGVAGAYFPGVFGKPGTTTTQLSPVVLTTITQTSGQLTAKAYQGVSAVLINSPLGPTLTALVCGIAAPQLADKVNQAMDIITQQAATVQTEIEAAGIQVVSCANPKTILFRATAPIQAIVAYVQGGMTDTRTFRTTWIRG